MLHTVKCFVGGIAHGCVDVEYGSYTMKFQIEERRLKKRFIGLWLLLLIYSFFALTVYKIYRIRYRVTGCLARSSWWYILTMQLGSCFWTCLEIAKTELNFVSLNCCLFSPSLPQAIPTVAPPSTMSRTLSPATLNTGMIDSYAKGVTWYKFIGHVNLKNLDKSRRYLNDFHWLAKATAKDVLLQACKTEKLLKKYGCSSRPTCKSTLFLFSLVTPFSKEHTMEESLKWHLTPALGVCPMLAGAYIHWYTARIRPCPFPSLQWQRQAFPPSQSDAATLAGATSFRLVEGWFQQPLLRFLFLGRLEDGQLEVCRKYVG